MCSALLNRIGANLRQIKESTQGSLEEGKAYTMKEGLLTACLPSLWGFPVGVSYVPFLSSTALPSALWGAVQPLPPAHRGARSLNCHCGRVVLISRESCLGGYASCALRRTHATVSALEAHRYCMRLGPE